MPLPSIIFDDFTSQARVDDFTMDSPIPQESANNDLDIIITDDPVHDYASSIHNHTSPSAYHSGSDISAHLPPSSHVSTGASSAVSSDLDVLPPSSDFLKPVQQTGLLNFFSIVPADEVHAAWGKRKRDNRERDEKEHAETMRQEEEWREEKRQKLRERNRLSQQKHRSKAKSQNQTAGIQDKSGRRSMVSEIFTLKIANL